MFILTLTTNALNAIDTTVHIDVRHFDGMPSECHINTESALIPLFSAASDENSNYARSILMIKWFVYPPDNLNN